MSKKKEDTVNGKADTTPMQALPLQVHAQYIRDCSFENPNAPDSLRAGQEQPKTDISVNMDSRPIESDKIKHLYEVSLRVMAKASRGSTPVFVAEVEYGTLVSLGDVPEDKHHPLLLIEVPRLTFPFLRQTLAELTQQGGYPPLVLSPVDFTNLYIQRFSCDLAKDVKKTDKKAV